MIIVPLQAIPNQSLSLQLDGDSYSLVLRNVAVGLMAIDITRNDEIILSGERIIPAYPIIPYLYLATGNFIFLTQDDAYPDYLQFGITQTLIYASQEEIEAINAST